VSNTATCGTPGPNADRAAEIPAQVVGIVQRREVDHLVDAAEHGVVDLGRLPESLPAMRDAMPDGLDLTDAGDGNPGIVAGGPRKQVVEGGAMIAQRGAPAQRRCGAGA
jgi:hypothetical protein